jgi:diguanylate cyclase (GGDEF)-like protein/PAS domain S-box-containing protein
VNNRPGARCDPAWQEAERGTTIAARRSRGSDSGLEARPISDDKTTDFRQLAENSADIICRLSPELMIIYISPSVFDILGWRPDELVGKAPDWLIFADDLPIMRAGHARSSNDPLASRPVALRMRHKSGALTWVEVNARVVRDRATSDVKETVIVIRDITGRKAREDELLALAMTDALTGLANRRAFDEALEREWQRTLREGSQMSLLLLDLDHFKSFNDTYGHQVGDDCLRAVATAVRTSVRASDFACRYGGEEIVVILPGTDAAGAFKAAESLRLAIEALALPHVGKPADGDRLTASIGVATAVSRDGGTVRLPEALLIAADAALYKAKHLGRNRIATALLVAPKI